MSVQLASGLTITFGGQRSASSQYGEH